MKAFKIILFMIIGAAFGGAAVFYLSPKAPAPEAPAAREERKILFYRNPMDPKVTSAVPMKDPMGMDYIPVYEDEAGAEGAPAPGGVAISPEKIQKIGVKSEEARKRAIKRVIRTVGRVDPVEDKVQIINAKVPGWVEKLHVSRTDQMVAKGTPLLELYSPELIAAQEEYILALKSVGQVRSGPPEVRERATSLAEAARKRLKYWDISDDQIERLGSSGKASRTLTIRSPGDGSVTDKMIVEGQKIEAGEPLFKIIDHSRVWVYGEIYEYEIPFIKVGEKARLTPSYSSGEVYWGKVEHIYTHLGSIRYTPEEGTEVRTAKVRFSLNNPEHKLKLGMYLNVEISVRAAESAVAVPDSSVIDTGERQIVIIDKRDGTFEPKVVTLGAKGEGYTEIKAGVRPGDWVVTSANFLIDSESNLRAAVSGMKKDEAGKKEDRPSAQGHVH